MAGRATACGRGVRRHVSRPLTALPAAEQDAGIVHCRWPRSAPGPACPRAPARVRRGYFECRYGQLHVHNAMPPGRRVSRRARRCCACTTCPGSGRVFAPFLRLAGRDRSVYAPDLPGFGESDAPVAAPHSRDYVGALGDFLDAMRLRKLDVLGLAPARCSPPSLPPARGAQIGRVVLRLGAAPGGPSSVPFRAEAPLPEQRSAARRRWRSYPVRERLAQLTQRLLVLRPRDDLWEATARVARGAAGGPRAWNWNCPADELLARAPEPPDGRSSRLPSQLREIFGILFTHL